MQTHINTFSTGFVVVAVAVVVVVVVAATAHIFCSTGKRDIPILSSTSSN